MTVVAETSFLVVMLLTGMGWRISRQRLSSRGRQLLAVMVIMFLIFNTFFELCENSPSPTGGERFFDRYCVVDLMPVTHRLPPVLPPFFRPQSAVRCCCRCTWFGS